MTKLKTDIIERKYWTIGRVAKELGLLESKLRYWESVGLIRPWKVGARGNNPPNTPRTYTKQTFMKIKLINDLRILGIQIKLVREAINKEYARELLDYLNRMK